MSHESVTCQSALAELASEGEWPRSRWRRALRVWSEEKVVTESLREMALPIGSIPDNVLQEVDDALAWWIKSVANSNSEHEAILLALCRRVLRLWREGSGRGTSYPVGGDEPVNNAINHPVGQIAQALTAVMFKRNPNDNDRIPADLKPLLTELCDVQIEPFLHGRVILCSQLIGLFRVDPSWSEHHLVPLFRWDKPSEARAAWSGFLWSPRLYPPVLVALKPQLLETAKHYSELGQHQQRFAAFLTHVALGPTEAIQTTNFVPRLERFRRMGSRAWRRCCPKRSKPPGSRK